MSAAQKSKKAAEPKKVQRLVLVRGAVVNWQCGDRRETSPASAIGVTGLFIATKEPPAAEEQVSLAFDVPGGDLRARGVVRASIPRRGMTVEFAPMSREDRANLQALMKYLPAYTEETAPAAPPAPDESARRKRRYPRITLAKGLKVAWQGDGRKEISTANTLGQGGMFIITVQPTSVDATLRLLFDGAGGEILTNATVRDSRAGKGMGVEFAALGKAEMQRLTGLLASLLVGDFLEAGTDDAAAKRRYKRVDLPRGLIVAWRSDTQSEMSIAPTVGRGGMFIATLDPAPAGAKLRILFEIPGGEILAAGVVRDSRPGRGMGIEFTEMGPQEIARLEELLNKLLR